MNLDEAIEILKDACVGVEAFDDEELPDAIKLGMEALKWIQENRIPGMAGHVIKVLPGETEEQDANTRTD